jgi:hypothetical protein
LGQNLLKIAENYGKMAKSFYGANLGKLLEIKRIRG